MAQAPSAGLGDPGGGFRLRHRRQRRREFLDTALSIITSEGVDALTMQRVTEDLDCSVGSIYHYFPSKGALMAELQSEALDVIARSLLASQMNLERALVAGQAGPALVALARPVAAARFWVAAEDHLPLEVELLRRQFATSEILIGDDDVGPVLEAALALLEMCRRLLDDAVAAGALDAGPNLDRALVLISGTTGVLLTSGLRRCDDALFAGQRLAQWMVADLLRAWGVDEQMLRDAEALVDGLVVNDELVPVVVRADEADEEVLTG